MNDYELLEVFLHEEHSREEILQALIVYGNLIDACIQGGQNHSATIDDPEYVDKLIKIKEEARKLPKIIQEKLPTYFSRIESVIETHKFYSRANEGIEKLMDATEQQ
jgi:hypothetical protein